MNEPRVRRGKAAGETDDVEQLRARIRELEAELRARPAASTQAERGSERLKVVATGLGVTTVMLAPPAFLTARRWVRWWRA